MISKRVEHILEVSYPRTLWVNIRDLSVGEILVLPYGEISDEDLYERISKIEVCGGCRKTLL
jgi:hypothetical protein